MKFGAVDIVIALIGGIIVGAFIMLSILKDCERPTEWKDGGLIKHDKAVYRLVEVK